MDIQEKFKEETGIYAYDTDNQKYKREYIIWLENHIEQLTLTDVVSSSDKIVIELSDKELQIVTRQELSKMQDDALEFDGFEGWIVRGKLV